MSPKLAVKAFVIRGKKVLLLKPRILDGSIRGWDGPGGHVKRGESLLEALKREVFEETGLKIKTAVPIKSLVVSQNKTEYLIFLCTVFQGKVILSKEHLAFRWVSLKDFEIITGVNLTKELSEIKIFLKKIIN